MNLSEVWDFESKDTHYSIINGAMYIIALKALLLPFESCNLGSINLSNILNENHDKDWRKNIDWDRYVFLIRNAVNFLDHVIDKNQYPLPEIDTVSKRNSQNRSWYYGVP